MTKLKTLKDISFEGTEDRPTEWFVTTEALKSESIKWIKEKGAYPSSVKTMLLPTWHVTEWIRHFFNITEEDLK